MNVKKSQAESIFRQMFNSWEAEKLSSDDKYTYVSFVEFDNWIRQKGYSHYYDFRSTESSKACVERWFNDRFGQNWRN